MIPVLGIPCISRPDLFTKTIESINHPVGKVIVVDNSRDDSVPALDGVEYLRMHRNMGVSWSWNTIIRQSREADWWCISNADIEFGPTDLSRLDEAMKHNDLVLVGSMALFGINADCIQKVGWFDENFVPAYCEDNDYVWRAKHLGVRIEWIDVEFSHFGSATIRSDEYYRNANNRSYPQNVAYFQKKWGGIMGEERFETPFDAGGSPRDVPPLDFYRLRALSWD